MSDIEGRYKALIQPIKDIAANWDIDIAESLTEYLEDLDNLRISIDGGKSNLNFAEAALLIQGSTAVYSKKVEYLHQLVLQSLEFITNKKSNTTTTAQGGKTSKSIEDDDILFLDNDASFLLLDHIVEEGHNINLKTSAPTNLSNQRNSRHSNSFASENNTSRVSMSLMHSILSDDQGSASLKLSTSMVDGSGALLLCGSYPTTSTGARFQPNSDRSSLQNSFHANTSFDARAGEAAHDMDMFGDDGGDHWGGGDDDGYDGYNGNDDVVADTFPCADSSAPMTLGTPAKAVQPFQAVATVPNASSSSVTNKSNLNVNNAAIKRRAAPLKDMYAQLDPHQALSTSKEARRGKTYKIPLALLKPPRNPAEISLDHLYADIKVTNTATFLHSGAVPVKGLFDTSLLPILQLKRKQMRQARLASLRTNRATETEMSPGEYQGTTAEPMQYQNLHLAMDGLEHSMGKMQSSMENIERSMGRLEAGLQNISRVEEMWTQDYDDNFDSGGGGDYHMDDGGDDYEAPDNHATDRVGDVLATAGGFEGGDGADWAEETEEEALARRVANVLNEDLNQSNRSSYESICQKYIDNFNQGAHMFAKETQLSRRVAEWTQRLEPILQQQEESAQFDIHAYCETFLEGVDEAIVEHDEALEELEAAGIEPETDEVPGEVSFGEVVAGQSSAEVCRIFLACLQLVNHGSISITPCADVNQWTFLPETAVALKGTQSTASRSASKAAKPSIVATPSSEGRSKGAMHPFRIRRIATVKKSHIANDIENYRAPSLHTTVRKGALKSALAGKGKGTKRVQMDMPSNITITI